MPKAKARLKASEKLMLRLTKDLGVKFSSEAKFKRLCPGHWQRSAGAWLWVIDDGGPGHTHMEIGSIYTVTDILAAKKIEFYHSDGGTEVMPKWTIGKASGK